MVIQCCALQFLAGRVTQVLKVAPACSETVSPQAALLIACCTLPPAGTVHVFPGEGVFANVLCTYTRGNSAGPSKVAAYMLPAITMSRSARLAIRATNRVLVFR